MTADEPTGWWGLSPRQPDPFPQVPDDVAAELREFLDSDPGIAVGWIMWLSPGQPAVMTVRQPIH